LVRRKIKRIQLVYIEMKVIGLNCSARENGNTYQAVRLALDHLKSMGLDTELHNLRDFDIRPCRRCNMECYFEKLCPDQGEAEKLASLLEEGDALIVGAPIYNGTIPANLASFLERNPFPYDEVLVGKVTGAIVVGSLGSIFALLVLTSWLAPKKRFVGWVDLDPRMTAARNQSLKNTWLEGTLLKDEKNRKRVLNLATAIYKGLKGRRF
jgi:multimeric flavodoxin WrbA